jgi:hypothetical protein
MREDEVIPVDNGETEMESINPEEAKLLFFVFFLCFLIFFFFMEGMIHKYQPLIGH